MNSLMRIRAGDHPSLKKSVTLVDARQGPLRRAGYDVDVFAVTDAGEDVCVSLNIDIYRYMYIHNYTHMHMYTYIYIYIYICSCCVSCICLVTFFGGHKQLSQSTFVCIHFEVALGTEIPHIARALEMG